MRDVAAHRAKRGPFNSLQLQGEGGDGVALDGGQNARRWYYDRGWRRGYQNTGWGHGTRHLCDKRCGVRHRRTKEHSQQIR